MSHSTVRLLAGATSAALLVAACGGGGSADPTTTLAPETTTTSTEVFEPSTTSSPPSTSAPSTSAPAPAADVPRQPLTGEIIADPADLVTRPALVVKIDNQTPARVNHTGLAVADIVFEEIVEDGITRFAAVFHTQDADPVGPIRSGRSQDVDILSSFNYPLFAWSGGNPGVTRLIRDSFLTDLNAQRSPGYYRGPGSAPHDLYSTTEDLWAQTPDDHPGAPPQQWGYVAPNSEISGQEISGVDLALRRIDIAWDWDEDRAAFLRRMEGEFHVDKTYGQITATNVIVMAVEYKPSSIDRNSPEAQTLGEGLVYVFSNGKMVEGKWSRALAVGPIRLNDLDGNPILLTPGNTWVELAEMDTDAGPDESPIEMTIRGR